MYLGIEIGGTKLQIVAGETAITLRERCRLTVDPAAGAAGIRRQIEQALPALLARYPVRAVGVGFGGPVDWRSGRIARSHQIAGWSGFDLTGWLQPLIRAPVVVDNDANLAALGEAIHGAGAGFNPTFYFNLGSGVGGGLVVDGNIYHGLPPGEIEFGHLRLDRAGTTVESRCSGWAADKKIRDLTARTPDSQLARLVGNSTGGEARHLAAALAAGDPDAQSIVRETAEDLAFALGHVVQLLHPALIVLGGGLAQVGEPLRAAIARTLPRYVMEAFLPAPPVCLAKLGEDAVPAGAVERARQLAAKLPA